MIISYYISFLLYLCVDYCYDIHEVPDKNNLNPGMDKLGEGSIVANVCSYCFEKWKASAIGNASEYTTFLFFSRETGVNYTEIQLGSISSLNESGFDLSKDTKILIHGWIDNGYSSFSAEVRDAYLLVEDVNIISVNWSPLAMQYFYPIPRVAVEPVGHYVASFVDWLVLKVGVPVGSIHLIGHSLGAQAAGVVGEHVYLQRITGLDPAGPGFDSDPVGRLDAGDAKFVDVIHTCGKLLGFYDQCGHVDFYPNGGTYNQPGCSLDFGHCSHVRSVLLFVESIVNTTEIFSATACDSWKHYRQGVCDNETANATAVMGEYVSFSAKGKFFLRTAGQPPYALGNTTGWHD